MKGIAAFIVLLRLGVAAAAYADDYHRVTVGAGDCATIDHTLVPNTNYDIFLLEVKTNGCAQDLIT